MPGCFGLLILIALVAFVAGQGASVEGLPAGFALGAIIGLLVTTMAGWAHGWNAHVDAVEQRDTARARENAQRDRR